MSGRAFAVLVLSIVGTLSSFSQQTPFDPPSAPNWPVLVDPVCPVPAFPGMSAPANSIKEMRVMYFPKAGRARIKDPQSLKLVAGFEGRGYGKNRAVVAFTRKDDHWEAALPIEAHLYVIFHVEDEKTNIVDDNDGRLWDVVTCDPDGEKNARAILMQAETYSGNEWPEKVHRAKDYSKAIAILKAATATENWTRFSELPVQMWHYEVLQYGDNTEAWAKVSKEIDQFVADHPSDKTAAYAAGTFIIRYENRYPAEDVEKTINALDAKVDPKNSLRAQLDLAHAERMHDSRAQARALQAFIEKYPDNSLVAFAASSRFFAMYDLDDVSGAEFAFAQYRDIVAKNHEIFDPSSHQIDQAMAILYVSRGVKLEAAVKLLDDDLAAIRNDTGMRMPPESLHFVEAQYGEIRARAYLGLHRPELALAEARKAFPLLKKHASIHFVLAQAYAGVGDKQNALSEYFEAALMPSNKDLEYRAELASYYRKNFGNEQQFEAALRKRIADRFAAANYVPKLLDKPAPALEFTTLKGEKFDAAALTGKTVVVNFWAPG